MLKAIVGIALALFTATAAVAQTAADQLSFEVASVKPAAPPAPGQFMVGMRGGPGTPDPGQIAFSNVTQRMLLARAYGVQDFQISGPGWLETERYDIVAKVPKGATKEQFNVMLQNLLAERFHLTLHRETKDLPLYALVVAKSGSKLKPSAPPAAEPAAAPDGPGPGPPPGPPPGELGPPRLQLGKDGMPMLPPGTARRPGVMMVFINGRVRLIGTGQPISQLADALARQLGRPVKDQTGLTGNYDFTLDFDPEGSLGGRGMMPPPPPGMGGEGPGANPPESEAASLFTAVQELLGLKLEQKKGPLDLLVIDHSEKAPVEN